MVNSTGLTSRTESQDPRSNGQNGPTRRQLLLLTHRPRYAEYCPDHLPRH